MSHGIYDMAGHLKFICFGCAICGKILQNKVCFANPSDILLCPSKYTTPELYPTLAVKQVDDFFF